MYDEDWGEDFNWKAIYQRNPGLANNKMRMVLFPRKGRGYQMNGIRWERTLSQ
jgi:hypothetical protein